LLAIVGAVAVLYISLIGYLLSAAIFGAIDLKHATQISADQQLIAQCFVYAALGLYLLFVVPALAKKPLRELGFQAPGRRDIAIALAGTIAMTLAVDLSGSAIAALSHRHDTETAVALMQQMKTPLERYAFFATACILAPLIEELAFRVFLFNALTRYVSVIAATIVSGILFGLVHSTSIPQLLTLSIPLALGGMVLAFVYTATRCYWANVITHGLFNTVSVVALFVFHAK